MEFSGNAAQHSDRLHSLLATIPGLKIITPATSQDVYSMLRSAIQDDSPVICITNRTLFWREEEVNKLLKIPIGISNKVKDGTDLTVVVISSCLKMVEEILPEVERLGVSVELIDIRTVKPLDYIPILESVEKTGRVLICDIASKTGSTASEIASVIQEKKFLYLKESVHLITAEDSPVPFARVLENEVLVTKEKILKKIISIVNGGR
jgi:pyruvate dehydrogenase E1 component beta subunit